MVEGILKTQRRGTAAQETVAVQTTDTPLAATMEERVALTFCNCGANVVSVALGKAAVAGEGITLSANGGRLELTLLQHGAQVKGPWRAIAAGGVSNVSVTSSANREL